MRDGEASMGTVWYTDAGIILKEKGNTVQEPEMIQHERRQEKRKRHRTQSRAGGRPAV